MFLEEKMKKLIYGLFVMGYVLTTQNATFAEPVKPNDVPLFAKKVGDAVLTCKANIKNKKVKLSKVELKDLEEREKSLNEYKAKLEAKLDARNKDPFPDASMINNAVTAYGLVCKPK